MRRSLLHASVAVMAPLLAGCGYGEVFASFPPVEQPGVAEAPYPSLLEASERARAAPRPDPADGATILRELGAEAAASRADAARVSVPVFEVEALEAEAAAVRAGPPAP